MLPMFRTGLYRHCDGGLYRVVCVARHSETGEPMAIYINLEDVDGPRWNARPMKGPAGFDELVAWPDGLSRPRFTEVGKL
jgi:hypothetical protein